MTFERTALTDDKLFEIHAYLSQYPDASVREIQRSCGLSSTSTVQAALDRLEAQGAITIVRKHKRARRLNYTACYRNAAGMTGSLALMQEIPT